MKCHQSGYTLIELAVTLGLIAIIFASGLAITNVGIEKNNITVTNAQLTKIEFALEMFINRYKRLPCPTSFTRAENTASFGVEDTCANAAPAAGIVQINGGTSDELWVGTVPTRTLGLSDRDMFDIWGGRIVYAVPKSFATNGNLIKSAVGNDNTRIIIIRDVNNNTIFPQPAAPAVPFNNPVTYVLLSHGLDRKGAYNAAGVVGTSCPNSGTNLDIENCDHTDAVAGNRDIIFRDMAISDSNIANQYFHDLIRWKPKIKLGAAALN
jgi:prepilin-type N-terminal cleavage/methylation domain-containing protein